MLGRTEQRKGARGETELMNILKAEGYQITRGGSLSYGNLPDLSGLPHIHIECKRVERLNLSEAMKQAELDANRFHDGFPSVFHRKSRKAWLVTMRLDDWLLLYKRAEEANE